MDCIELAQYRVQWSAFVNPAMYFGIHWNQRIWLAKLLQIFLGKSCAMKLIKSLEGLVSRVTGYLARRPGFRSDLLWVETTLVYSGYNGRKLEADMHSGNLTFLGGAAWLKHRPSCRDFLNPYRNKRENFHRGSEHHKTNFENWKQIYMSGPRFETQLSIYEWAKIVCGHRCEQFINWNEFKSFIRTAKLLQLAKTVWNHKSS